MPLIWTFAESLKYLYLNFAKGLLRCCRLTRPGGTPASTPQWRSAGRCGSGERATHAWTVWCLRRRFWAFRSKKGKLEDLICNSDSSLQFNFQFPRSPQLLHSKPPKSWREKKVTTPYALSTRGVCAVQVYRHRAELRCFCTSFELQISEVLNSAFELLALLNLKLFWIKSSVEFKALLNPLRAFGRAFSSVGVWGRGLGQSYSKETEIVCSFKFHLIHLFIQFIYFICSFSSFVPSIHLVHLFLPLGLAGEDAALLGCS